MHQTQRARVFNLSLIGRCYLHNKHSLFRLSKRNVFVQISQTPNVLSQKFIPSGYRILPSSNADGQDTGITLDISSYKDAMNKSGLARELFIIDGICNVFMTSDYVTVTVEDTTKWPDVQGQVVAVINDYLLSNKPVLEDSFDINKQAENDVNYDEEDDEVIAIIRELIDTRIRPNVQYDGGDVIFRGFDHDSGKLTLQLVGACKGCASSQETLHNGIERMLKFYVPEVSYVEEFIDEDEERLKDINEKAFNKVQEILTEEQANEEDNKRG